MTQVLIQYIRELTLTHSHNGRPVTVCFPQHFAWKGDQKPVVVIGGVHGDKPEGVQLATRLRKHTAKAPRYNPGPAPASEPTPGSLGEYGWSIHNTSVICVEEREQETMEESWARFRPAFDRILGIA
jgi:hypothetical protein